MTKKNPPTSLAHHTPPRRHLATDPGEFARVEHFRRGGEQLFLFEGDVSRIDLAESLKVTLHLCSRCIADRPAFQPYAPASIHSPMQRLCPTVLFFDSIRFHE